MSDRISLVRRVSNLDRSPEFDGVSRLICHINDDEQITVGNDSGYTIEFENPLMTRTVLNSMLNKIRGYQYQPFGADGAHLDPAAEMGDGISVRDIYGGMYTRSRDFSRLMTADIGAPADQEIDHEYKYESKQDRKVKRELNDVRATLLVEVGKIEGVVETVEGYDSRLTIAEGEISAKVSKTGGSNVANSFSWRLNESGHYWYANGSSTPVLKITKDGLSVNGSGTFTGTITASSGNIGGFKIASKNLSTNDMTWADTSITSGIYIGSSGIKLGQKFSVSASGAITATSGTIGGFKITSDHMYTENMSWTGNQNSGVYVGTNGIKLGKNFKVTASGAVTAVNCTLTGTLTIGGKTITAATLQSGAATAAANSSTWTATSDTVSSNSGSWTTGATNGTSAKNTWDDAHNDYIGTDIVANYLNIRNGGNFVYHGSGIDLHWSSTLGAFFLGSYGES